MTDPRRTSAAIIAALALAVCLVPGCQRWRESRRADATAQPADPPAPQDPITGRPAPLNPGLEVVVWTAQDFGYSAARALLPHADRPAPIPDADLQAWRRAGLRVVAVPIDQIDAVIAQAPPIFPVQRVRFGQLTNWAPIIRGPLAPALALDQSTPLPPGRPRLIARAWIEPDLSAGAPREVVRVELGVQIERANRTPRSIVQDPALGTIADQGLIVAPLLTAFPADGRDAIVIVGEAPSVDWSRLPEPSLAADAPADSPGPQPPTADPPADQPPPGDSQSTRTRQASPIGPAPPAERTLGEWMLTAPGVPARNGRPASLPRRVFVVLIPRTPSPAPADGETP